MRDVLKDFLFSKGCFVRESDAGQHIVDLQPPVVIASLARLFNIRIVANPDWADIDMVTVAKRNLGVHVPPPFYRGFPFSVRELSLDKVILDRLIHYVRTYGLGDFSRPGYSIFEDEVVRPCFDEDVEVREVSIIGEAEAIELLRDAVDALMASSRPLSDLHYLVVRAFIEEYGYEVTECRCKDTACRLLLDARDPSYARLLKLSDVIRLVEWLQFLTYESTDIKRLNLRNRDRKLVTAVLDYLFERGDVDARTCLEKKRLWKGLLHHLHYRPVNEAAARFLHDIRNNDARSVYSEFERLIDEGPAESGTRDACDLLLAEKGTGAVLRHLDYLLSMSWPFGDIDHIIGQVATSNKVLLIQLLYHYAHGSSRAPRVFRFQRLGMLRVHYEDASRPVKPRSHLTAHVAMRVSLRIRAELERACAGTLGRVYADEGLRRVALPLQEGTSMGGVGTLPRGSCLPIPEGKKIRAFTYWERVNDIDLSTFALDADGELLHEFSWRTVEDASAIVFSGDQTSGYHGGSEYFDIDLERFAKQHPLARYLVFCDNVYSGTPFSECTCRAGYMMRDVEDSGEVFEPATVKSSFAITCVSTFAYLFAIDLAKREVVWLNVARNSRERVAGKTDMGFLREYLEATSVINLYDFARMLATEVVDDPAQADVVFSDHDEPLGEGAELIRSLDTERVMELLN